MFKTDVQSHIFIFNPNDLVKRQNYNNKKHLKKWRSVDKILQQQAFK